MKTLLIVACLMVLSFAGLAADKESRCFELRTYYAAPGKLDDLKARFRDHTMTIFAKHGMTSIGYWTPVDNTNNTLVYMLAYPSREAAAASWKEFGADPDWKAAAKASEANGRLVTKVESTYLTATDFSPMVTLAQSGEPRLFELRIYTASPGKLDDLFARFRDHTVALFSKHGMTNFGYWTPMDANKGAGEKLVYIIAHKDREASAESWKGFRDDPDWKAAQKASEVNGKLTVPDGVKSTFMAPTDFSPTK